MYKIILAGIAASALMAGTAFAYSPAHSFTDPVPGQETLELGPGQQETIGRADPLQLEQDEAIQHAPLPDWDGQQPAPQSGEAALAQWVSDSKGPARIVRAGLLPYVA